MNLRLCKRINILRLLENPWPVSQMISPKLSSIRIQTLLEIFDFAHRLNELFSGLLSYVI